MSSLALAHSVSAVTLEDRVSQLEQDVAAHAQKVADLEQASATQAAQIAQMLVGLTTEEQQIVTLAGHVAAISDEVNAVNQKASDLIPRVAALEQRVAALQGQLDAHIESFSALLLRVQGVENRVAALEAGSGGGGGNAPIAVDCGAGQSLADAITHLKPGPNTLNVSGACSEPAVIVGRDGLALLAEPGASIPSASVSASRDVRIVGFHIQGGGTAINVDRGSVVEIRDNTIEGAATGISLVSSEGALSGNKVLLPTAVGISLSERSTATVQGLLVLQGGQGTPPGVVGLAVTGGSRARLDALLADSLIYDFATGVRVVENSSLSIVPGDTPSPLLKIWRNQGGVVVNASSFNVVGNVPFDNNARGITASDGAAVSLSTGVSFVGNQLMGITLSNSASARVGSRVTFTGVGTAIDVAVSSSVLFSSTPVTFTTNSKDINCDAFSVAAGLSKTNATLITCANTQP
jgi:hypothetical protein